MDYFGIAISFLGALGLFLFGLKVVSSSLEEAAGPAIKKLLVKMSKTQFRGVLFGTGMTALIQSSTAVTVMAVGFVNAGLVSLIGVVGIIMGANLGTTVVSWFMASAEWNLNFLSPQVMGSIAVLVGASLLLFAKREKLASIAKVITGFGVLFVGLSSMPAAVRPLAELEIVRELFLMLAHNPLLSLLLGIVVTAIIQSSNASIGILQSMAMAGVIPWSAAVFIVLGQNVGTCFTTMLSSLGATKNARAASFVHFIYNMMGAVIFGLGAFAFFSFINTSLGKSTIAATDISMLHTGYNILLILFLFPMGKIILKLALKMAGRDKEVDVNEFEVIGLDANILEMPEHALENSSDVVSSIIGKLRDNILLSTEIFKQASCRSHTLEALSTNFYEAADKVEEINKVARNFLTRLYEEELTDEQTIRITELVQGLTSMKRMSRYTREIARQADHLLHEGYSLDDESLKLLESMLETSLICFDDGMKALLDHKVKKARKTIVSAEELISMRNDYKLKQKERVFQEGYDFECDVIFMEVLKYISEIARQAESIARIVVNEI